MMGKDSSMMKAWEATVKKTQAVAKKRANSIFGSTYVAASQGDENENKDETEVYHAERVLPNGDYYKGEWVDNFPHGKGKYLWTDGCIYVGEWVKGKTMGKGRFTWPTGPSYEGEFKSGYMDGIGSYTAANGDTYKGQWVMNLKHGHGEKSYSNGDKYEGEWRRGLQDGQGKYEWKDENYYIGEWRNGSIWGKGSFVWSNGNRYDGYWEDGLPKGNGTFKWVDGSFYVGNWSKDPVDQSGTYYPSSAGSSEGHLDWEPQQVYIELSEYQICPGEKVSILPSQKRLAVWRSTKGGLGDCVSGKPRRMSVDAGRASVGLEKPSDRMQIWGGGEGTDINSGTITPIKDGHELFTLHAHASNNPSQPLKAPKKSKRQGETICKGHKNYELMLNLQLGIR
jgi:1-phosphatidylinositol-4-phosphate 5-kinase